MANRKERSKFMLDGSEIPSSADRLINAVTTHAHNSLPKSGFEKLAARWSTAVTGSSKSDSEITVNGTRVSCRIMPGRGLARYKVFDSRGKRSLVIAKRKNDGDIQVQVVGASQGSIRRHRSILARRLKLVEQD